VRGAHDAPIAVCAAQLRESKPVAVGPGPRASAQTENIQLPANAIEIRTSAGCPDTYQSAPKPTLVGYARAVAYTNRSDQGVTRRRLLIRPENRADHAPRVVITLPEDR